MTHLELCQFCEKGYQESTGSVNEVEFLVEGNVVSFRGTEASTIDVIRDIRMAPWRDKRTGWCHAGFLKGARNVVDGPLRAHINPSEPITFTGHSLGAAMSLIAAQMLYAEGYQVKEWVGFGCPKAFIGKRDLRFKATSYRNAGDPVTEVPPGWIIPYKHPVELVDIGEKTGHSIDKYIEALS